GTKTLPAEVTGSTLRASATTTRSRASGNSFVDDLDLLVDHLPGKPVDCDVHPVMLLAFDHKIGKRIRCIWTRCGVRRIAPALGYYVNHEVPGASLARVRKGADDQLTSLFVA